MLLTNFRLLLGWKVLFLNVFSYEEFNQEEINLFYKELIKYGGKIYLCKGQVMTSLILSAFIILFTNTISID